MSKRWYVVQTKNSQETVAHRELQNQGFNVFLPTFLSPTQNYVKKPPKSSKTIKKPLFPAYLFANFDVERERWKCINNTRGCVGLVGCNEDYVSPLPVGYVEELISQCDDQGILPIEETIENTINFYKGQPLGIKGYQGFNVVGEYVSSDEKRIILLLTLLNRKIRLSLPITSVYPIDFSEKADGGSVLNST